MLESLPAPMGWAFLGICRYPTSILAHSAVGIEVLPGPKDTLGRMTWPPRAPAMSGMPGQRSSQKEDRFGGQASLIHSQGTQA